jgi:hypothetical protein
MRFTTIASPARSWIERDSSSASAYRFIASEVSPRRFSIMPMLPRAVAMPCLSSTSR